MSTCAGRDCSHNEVAMVATLWESGPPPSFPESRPTPLVLPESGPPGSFCTTAPMDERMWEALERVVAGPPFEDWPYDYEQGLCHFCREGRHDGKRPHAESCGYWMAATLLRDRQSELDVMAEIDEIIREAEAARTLLNTSPAEVRHERLLNGDSSAGT